MRISCNFDGGNIEVLNADAPNNIQLSIRKDNQSEFAQWFYFKLETETMVEHKMTIVDLDKSAYPSGWPGYHAVASYDRAEWFRVPSTFENNQLHIEFIPEQEVTYFAYFAPYSYDQHLNLLAWAQSDYQCRQEHLGETLDGRDMTLLVIGEEDQNKHKIWVTARQHPGETMAEWLVEGLLARLLDEDDGVARRLLDKAVFYVVPNMNPDGSVRGHLRTNAAGVNLNREWAEPTLEKSPEVFHVLNKMKAVGVDLFLDVHGDEAIPYNFVAGCEGNPGYNDRLASLEKNFVEALLLVTPEFQNKFGYPKDAPGKANLTIACNAVGERFSCLAYTLEMPFKDNDNLPDPLYGWSPVRCKQLGEDVLVAMNSVVDNLR
ncbi:M14 family metallopeptidase [Alteromonas sp. a30]|uniref:M14 family metallopeptidase n=1 Tax=Alteromonas sp. a30 TaxID=2730917 RepID=UPI00227E28A3|nr:M14-type cytosolic carboxypeptidase [Alteromonas sp. a30]MCY7294024.1 carboxypeptidase family protein [Alteromonas sp. a30]